MTAKQIKANNPRGKIIFPDMGLKVKTPEGFIEIADYYENGMTRRVVLAEKGDTTNIKLPERIDYDNERGTRGNERILKKSYRTRMVKR